MNRFLIVLLCCGFVQAQTPDSGKTTETPAFLKAQIKPFHYYPTDPLFWQKVTKNLDDNNPSFVLQDAYDQKQKYKSQSPEHQEADLATALALQKLSLSHAAFTLLVDIARNRIGSSMGEAALYYLNELAQKYLIDEKTLDGLLVDQEFSRLHPDIQSFVAYHKAIFNLRYGYKRWAEPELSEIQPENPWHLILDYWIAVGEVARGRIDKALALFLQLKDKKNLPDKYQQLTNLQIARLIFEKGEFQKAEDFYKKIEHLGLREHGRILLERAWTAYYLKDFSRALGLLRALKNPIFQVAISPEQTILEMIINRELCHFDAVEKIGKNFLKRFRGPLEAIRKRKPLHEQRELFYMATINRDLQDKANFIDQLRRERENFRRAGLQKFVFYDEMLEEYKKRDHLFQAELEPLLEKYARKSAENLLDAQEQVQFLQYTSKLDALRIIQPDEDRNYKAEKITTTKFKKIFWPVTKELWVDELNDYRVLISSRCGTNTTPEDLKLEREFR